MKSWWIIGHWVTPLIYMLTITVSAMDDADHENTQYTKKDPADVCNAATTRPCGYITCDINKQYCKSGECYLCEHECSLDRIGLNADLYGHCFDICPVFMKENQCRHQHSRDDTKYVQEQLLGYQVAVGVLTAIIVLLLAIMSVHVYRLKVRADKPNPGNEAAPSAGNVQNSVNRNTNTPTVSEVRVDSTQGSAAENNIRSGATSLGPSSSHRTGPGTISNRENDPMLQPSVTATETLPKQSIPVQTSEDGVHGANDFMGESFPPLNLSVTDPETQGRISEPQQPESASVKTQRTKKYKPTITNSWREVGQRV